MAIRGHFHNRQRQCRKAIECFRLMLLTDPAHAEAYAGLAKSYELLGRDAQREEVLRRSTVRGFLCVRRMARERDKLLLWLLVSQVEIHD